MKLSQNRQAILELFEEKERPLSIDEILKGLSRPRDRYQAVRQTLHRMVQDEQIVRLGRGRYAASRGTLEGEFDHPGNKGNTWSHLGMLPVILLNHKGLSALVTCGTRILPRKTLSPNVATPWLWHIHLTMQALQSANW